MHKLTFTLKQHTPIIHFQHDQDGATLRATEVKPKLDRFIIEKFKAQNIDYKKWLVGNGEHAALDYKMRILPIKPNNSAIEKGDRYIPMFFGNMGNEYNVNVKGTSIFDGDVILEILSADDNLNYRIESHFPSFLSVSNFGSRQSKGYGCFWLNDTKYDNVFPKYYFTIGQSSDWKEVLKKIELFYKSIRSGIQVVNKGLTTYYFKSLLFHYFNSKGLKWDKRLIKEDLMKDFITSQRTKWSGKEESFDSITKYIAEKYLVRDMLGLATSQDWKYPYKSKVEKEFTNTDETDKREIARYKSPLCFKPFEDSENNVWRIYFDFNEIPDAFHNATFKISGNRKSTKLTTPPATIFTIQKYFDFLFCEDSYGEYQVDIQSAEFPDHLTTSFLQCAFDEIRTNLKYNG